MSDGGRPAGTWFKSSRSNADDNCVETSFDGTVVRIRDSKYQGDPAAQPVITVTTRQWIQFLDVVAGRSSVSALSTVTNAIGQVTLTGNGISLIYTPAEWEAFTAGVALGEFTIAA
jgi:hypothetical protein